ncbi:MAG: NAD-dependent protein deacylase [Clostridia bacterium]|nr:NAD-dependent protein deacylase [Clostridia bacterium]
METQIAALQAMIDKARRIAFFGGAGVSTASGIPDFTGENGLYRQKYGGLTPEMMLSQSFFYLHPDLFYEFYREHMIRPDASPNAAHLKLAELEKAGKLSALITQNIDGLHRQAGNRFVYELHGSVHENRCIECGRFFSLDFVLSSQGVPKCPDCGGVIKPSVVLYGEGLDHYVSTGACREISRCDLLIVAGTSLTVEPAASMLAYFRGGSQKLAIINLHETQADARASLVIRGNVEKVLDAIHVNGI